MTQEFIINGHPKPKPGESFRGYLLRVVDWNGFKGIRYLRRKLGLFRFSYTSFSDEEFLNQFVTAIAPALCTTPCDLESTFHSHWAWPIYQSERHYLQGLYHHEVRLCPLCVKEKGFYHADWDFALSTHCPIHQCYLIDKCPDCHKAITWQGAYLDRCHNCEKLYSDNPVKKLPSDSPLHLLQQMIDTHRLFTIEKLVVICNRVHRLGDNVLAHLFLNRLPLSLLIPLCMKAASFIFSLEYRLGYKRWLLSTRKHYESISALAVTEPYRALEDLSLTQSLKNDLDVSFEPPADIKTINVGEIDRASKVSGALHVRTIRLNNIRDDIETLNLQEQIEDERLAKLLHVPLSSIKSLVTAAALTPTNTIERVSRYYFDLSEIADALTPISQSPDSQIKLVKLGDFISNEKLDAFALPSYVTIELVLKKQINLYRNEWEIGFMNQFVDEQQALSALDTEMLLRTENVTVEDLANILCTSRENIIELYEQGYIEIDNFWGKNNAKERTITPESFTSLIAQYISLNRLSHLSDKPVKAIRSKLKKQYGNSEITIKEGAKALYLYPDSNMDII